MSTNGTEPSSAEITSPSAPNATGQDKPAAEALGHDLWHDKVAGYVEHAHVNKLDLSTMFIDIDALKATNDEIGHAAGHRLIDMVDLIIAEGVRVKHDSRYPDRKPDLVTKHGTELRSLDKAIPGIEVPESQATRIDGDEFGILLPDTDREGANALAARLREALAKELKRPENHLLADLGVGVSIGIAALEPGMNTDDFLRQADRAMFANKLNQLRPLSAEQEAHFRKAVEYLERAEVRPRDVPKYIQSLGATAIIHAIEQRDEKIAAGQLALTMPETPQADS